jgi:hypothetical protein
LATLANVLGQYFRAGARRGRGPIPATIIKRDGFTGTRQRIPLTKNLSRKDWSHDRVKFQIVTDNFDTCYYESTSYW